MRIHIARQTSSNLLCFAKPNQRRAFVKLNSSIQIQELKAPSMKRV